jgi:hypothetical protein
MIPRDARSPVLRHVSETRGTPPALGDRRPQSHDDTPTSPRCLRQSRRFDKSGDAFRLFPSLLAVQRYISARCVGLYPRMTTGMAFLNVSLKPFLRSADQSIFLSQQDTLKSTHSSLSIHFSFAFRRFRTPRVPPRVPRKHPHYTASSVESPALPGSHFPPSRKTALGIFHTLLSHWPSIPTILGAGVSNSIVRLLAHVLHTGYTPFICPV